MPRILNTTREAISEDSYTHIEMPNETHNQHLIALSHLLSGYHDNTTEENLLLTATQIRDEYLGQESFKNHPFFLFMPSIDVTWSILVKQTPEEQLKFLKKAVYKYNVFRYDVYETGNSVNALGLISRDRGSSRRNGNAAINKVSALLTENGFSLTTASQLSDVNNFEFALLDRQHKGIYVEIIDTSNLSDDVKQEMKNKKPDFLIKVNNEISIIEHKHLKEAGGAQDKQYKEVIEFVKKLENIDTIDKVYGFIDGIYYNAILDWEEKIENENVSYNKNKITRVIRTIHEFYANQDYVPLINTEAFKEMITRN